MALLSGAEAREESRRALGLVKHRPDERLSNARCHGRRTISRPRARSRSATASACCVHNSYCREGRPPESTERAIIAALARQFHVAGSLIMTWPQLYGFDGLVRHLAHSQRFGELAYNSTLEWCGVSGRGRRTWRGTMRLKPVASPSGSACTVNDVRWKGAGVFCISAIRRRSAAFARFAAQARCRFG
jgi:hypothetical protein